MAWLYGTPITGAGKLPGNTVKATAAGATVTVTNKRTEAFVGHGAHVTADGAAATLNAGTGGFKVVTTAKPLQQGNVDSNSINSSPKYFNILTE